MPSNGCGTNEFSLVFRYLLTGKSDNSLLGFLKPIIFWFLSIYIVPTHNFRTIDILMPEDSKCPNALL